MNIRYLGSNEISEKDYMGLGGKASKLHELIRAGFSVPQGFVLNEAEFKDNLTQCVDKIGGFPVAVRSSCSLEDMKDASFAGLYETYLFIQNLDELKNAIEKCFQSKDSERVRDYFLQKKINAKSSDLVMTVLVQKMIDTKYAGVLFTLNPTNGHDEECYLEYCEGVGERLVSGHVTPTLCHYDWINEKVLSHVVNLEGTSILEEQIHELVFESLKIQAFFGSPQDIEWAIDKSGKLHILQSRPITTFTPREDFPEVTNADLKDGGISARVCTPMMFSAYYESMRFSMGDYFKKIKLIASDETFEWLYYAYGRAYWNAGAVKEGMKKVPGYREIDLDRDLGIQKDYGQSGPHESGSGIDIIINAFPILIGMINEFRDSELSIIQFRDQFEKRDGELKKKLNYLKSMNQEDFRSWLLEVIQFQSLTERTYFRSIYNNANFQSEFKGYLKKLKIYESGDEVDLMGNLSGVSHLDVQTGLKILKNVANNFGLDSDQYLNARESFLTLHYHHGPAELDLMVPRWGEKKSWVDDLVQSFSESVVNTNRFERARDKYVRNLNFLSRLSFLKKLDKSRDFLRMREEMRSYSTRAYYLLRLGLLEFAHRSNINEEDVFMFTLPDLIEHLTTPGKKLPAIEKRKLRYQGYRLFKAPNEFGGKIKMPTRKLDGSLVGLGCSSGEKVGRARVIKDIHQTLELTKDDILITVFTDPGWTPVLARVGAVVTEVGGLLSHAAVIGREYGIPAVLNLIDATTLIPDGALIKVNGKTGVVEILEKGPKA